MSFQVSVLIGGYLLREVDLTAGKMRRTVAADRLVDEYSGCRQNGDQAEQIHSVFAAQLVGKSIASSELRVVDIAKQR